jgi:quinol monooxygenase YgiN
VIEATLRIVAPTNKRAEVLEVMRWVKGPTEVATGCHICRILQDTDDDDLLMYHVRWETQRELEEHFRSERFRRLLPYIEMSLIPPEIEVNTIHQIRGMEFLVAALGSKTP